MTTCLTNKQESNTMALALQELVKEPLLTIPNFFIFDENQDLGSNSVKGLGSENGGINRDQAIPVIDLDNLMISGEAMEGELLKMHSACKEWGIFQLVNHGKSTLVEKVKQEIEAFYKLPLEEKMKYMSKPGEKEGYGQIILQSPDVQEKIDWADRFFMFVNPLHLRLPHLFPQLPSSLRETLEDYIQETQRLALNLLEMMAKNLEIDNKEMKEMFEDGLQSIRMTYYPPCPQPEQVIGLRPHSDGSGITILLQVNGQDGLQVKKDGVWIPVKIIPGAFVVNIGDVLEIFSNGIYKSVEHKVTVNSEKERISMGMFFVPKMEAEVGPAKTRMSKQQDNNNDMYKRISMNNFVNDFFSYKLNGKSFLESMKIQTANIKTN